MDRSYANVAVVLFDPVHTNRHLTRGILQQLGFRDIATPSTIEELAHACARSGDLVLLDVTEHEEALARFVTDLRAGKVTENPFAVVLTTTWNQSARLVRRFVNAGAEDIVVRPISGGLLEARIRQQVNGRKPFIVTADYIGPDRRHGQPRGFGEELIHVPNTLREKALGMTGNGSGRAIAEARLAVARRRVFQDAFKLCVEWRLFDSGIRTREQIIENTALISSDLKLWADTERFKPIAAHVDAVVSGAVALDPGRGGSADQLRALIGAAQEIMRGLDPRKNAATLESEIAETAARISRPAAEPDAKIAAA